MDCDSERIWKIVETQRHNVPKKKRTPGTTLSLFDRLYDCYVECTQKQNDKNFDKRFRNSVNLLQQLSPDHTHPSLVVNLYSDERGYSLILNPDGRGEEVFMPYEDNEIFSYLDNQEIPPVLMEVLSQTNHCHMYGGCIVCEVRNYRHPSLSSPSLSSHHSYDSYLIMLRPTSESILQMVNEIANETNCSPEDQLLLESKLLLATQPPICLDPSTEVVWVTNRLHYNRRKFHSPAMRRYLRRRSQARRARMYHTSLQKAPSELRLHDFLATTGASLKCPRPQFSDVWKQKKLPVPSVSTTSAKAIAKSVRDLASMLPEPSPSLTSPLDQHFSVQTPSNLPSASHLRTQGQGLADEFLESGGRTLPSSTATTPPQVAGGPPSPHPSPHKTTPTIVQGQVQLSLPPPTLQPQPQPPPSQPSLTISLPLFPSHAKSTLTIPTSHKPTPPLPPPTIPTATPTSLVEKIRGAKGGGTTKRPRPIAPAGPIPHSMVAMTAAKTKHTTVMGRPSAAVVTPGNQRPVLHTPKQMPRLQRPPQLPPLTGATQHTMPKLHRFTTPHLPTPPLSPQPPVSTSTRTTPPMPILHRLATGNGTPRPQSSVPKLAPPALKAVMKLKKLSPSSKS